MSSPEQATPALPIDPFRVNTSNIAAIESNQLGAPRPRGRPPQKDRVEEKELAKSKKEEEEREKAFRAATRLALEEKEKKAKDEQKERIKNEAHAKLGRTRIYRKICEYQRTFPDVFVGFKLPPADSPEATLQACLDDMRSMMSSNAADTTIHAMIPKIGYAMEWVVHDMGFNPKGWRLRNGNMSLGKVLEMPDVQEQLEPERTEAVIELRDYVTAPWFVRLGMKFALLADQFSAHQPRASSSSSPNTPTPPTQEDLEGL